MASRAYTNTQNEEDEAIVKDPSLKGKTRQEMGLESFRQTEIRSTVMGIPVTITEEVIAKACRVTPTGRFIWNITGKHPLMASYTSVVLKGNSATKMVNIDNSHRMLLKFLTECFLQKGGGPDQPSADHKLVLYFLASFNKINLPRYIMHHLCWAIKEGIISKRKQIPCGRLLSEIFTQGKVLEILRRNDLVSDSFLGTRTGKIINGKTLQNMKIIKKFSPDEKDLKESTAPTKLMKDFPSILQERNHEFLSKLVAESVKESGIFLDAEASTTPDDAPLPVKKKRTISEAGSEASGGQTKKAKGDKSDTPILAISSASKKRTRVDSSSLVNQEKLAKAREERAKKVKAIHQKCELSKVQMTPELAKEASEQAKRMLAERKKAKGALQAERDAKLKSIGIDGSSDFIKEKMEEVSKITQTVEKLAVKEAVKMLEQIPEASEAVASEATQTLALPSSNPTLSSSDSDLDDVPIGQRIKSLQKTSSKS